MQTTIGQRVKFLLDHFQLSARKFSREIGVAENNTQNYLPPSSREPGARYLELIALRFESINPDWLLTGRGEPFLPNAPAEAPTNKKISRSLMANNVGRDAIQNHGISGNEQALKREIELLKEQLVEKERLIQILLPK